MLHRTHTPRALLRQPVMRMAVVRSNDPACARRCSDWIALDGPIGIGSAAKFTRFIHALGHRKLPILVNSNGGSVRDALTMGRLIRANHLDVAVSKTALTSCPGDRAACATVVPDGLVTGTPVTAGSFAPRPARWYWRGENVGSSRSAPMSGSISSAASANSPR